MKIRNVLHGLLGVIAVLIFLFAGFVMDSKETLPEAAQELQEGSSDANLSTL